MERPGAQAKRHEGAKWSEGQTMETKEWDGQARKTKFKGNQNMCGREMGRRERDAENVSVCREKNAHS